MDSLAWVALLTGILLVLEGSFLIFLMLKKAKKRRAAINKNKTGRNLLRLREQEKAALTEQFFIDFYGFNTPR